MSNKYRPKKLYSFIDLLLICLLTWLVVGVALVFFDEQIVNIISLLLGG